MLVCISVPLKTRKSLEMASIAVLESVAYGIFNRSSGCDGEEKSEVKEDKFHHLMGFGVNWGGFYSGTAWENCTRC